MSATERPERSSVADAVRAPDSRIRALPGGVAAVAVWVLLWAVGGSLGLVVGGILLVAWAVLPATYAFAIGQIVFVAVMRPEGLLDTGLLLPALVELGLAGVLVGPSLRSADGQRTAAGVLIGGSVLGGVTLVSYALWDRVWAAAILLVGLGALSAYGLHRYELVVLEKVPIPGDSTGPGREGAAMDGESGRSGEESGSEAREADSNGTGDSDRTGGETR